MLSGVDGNEEEGWCCKITGMPVMDTIYDYLKILNKLVC
jgi:hypothetical protein